jgi:hypothetical protein
MIRKEYLDKFKKLYLDKYNITLSDEESTELATHFLNLMEILIRPKIKQTTVNIATKQESKEEGRQYATNGI